MLDITQTEIDLSEQISASLETLENNVVDYQQNKAGKPNLPLLQARERVSNLRWEFDAAIKALQIEENKGSWIDQLSNQILVAEREFQRLTERYENRVRDQITKQLFGRADYKSLSDGSKEMVRDHERVRVLRKFTLFPRKQMPVRQDKETGRHVSDRWPLEYLYERAELVAQKLVELRSHIATEEQTADQTPSTRN